MCARGQVDTFTEKAYGGNPACVVLLGAETPGESSSWMQRVAAELNISVTAFCRPVHGGGNVAWQQASVFHLRWFTPTAELDMCGHGTMATAAALLQGKGATGPRFYLVLTESSPSCLFSLCLLSE